jgi:alpha-galactosidase
VPRERDLSSSTFVIIDPEAVAIYHAPVKTIHTRSFSALLRPFLLPCLAFSLLLLPGYFATGRSQSRSATQLAATPPMGWNSWDSYGRTLDETSIKANAKWMAQNLKRFGWEYVVVDEGWYLTNLAPNGDDSNTRFEMDAYGRYVPVPARFPSAGKDRTFKPLADYLHSLGLKFGIHIIRGIPREAVRRNLPIAGSRFHAADAAETSDVCPWNAYNYGLNPSHPAAQAYYDSLARQYAAWAVDFIKIDCISDHPYKGDEIRMFSEAIARSGRAMVLSLSPGPTAIDKRAEVSRFAQMWRISDDVWDVWYSTSNFPQGVENQFARAALWASVARPGHWPDADMLPLGSLRPAAGWGEPRDTRLTHDEQRTLLTLWSIFRSPLIMGGNLLQADAWTTALLTNAEVIAVDQHSTENRPVVTSENVVIWTARAQSGKDSYVAVFNISDAAQTVHYAWKDLGLSAAGYRLRDLWEHRDLGIVKTVEASLPPHASVLYRAAPTRR